MRPDYPRPQETPTNRPLIEAWRDGRLAVQSCKKCAHAFFYPREVCPRCWSVDLEWIATSGSGQVVSYTLIHRPLHPAFEPEVPIVMAEIVLPEGVHLLARIVGEDRERVVTGAAVGLVPQREAGRYPLPTFKLR